MPFFKREKWEKKDWLVLAIALGLSVFCYVLFCSGYVSFSGSKTMNQAFLAKKGADGLVYVLDDGHERLRGMTQEGTVLFEIKNPDIGSGTLYIDDFCITGNGRIYVQASQWDEMYLSRELILEYNKKGRYVGCRVDLDYTNQEINRHRFYGIREEDGDIYYAELFEDEIVLLMLEGGKGEARVVSRIACQEANRALSDCIVAEKGTSVLILHKNGQIRRISQTQDTLLFDASVSGWEGVPYRMCQSESGNLYYTDIKNRTVVQMDAEGHNANVILSDTDTQTVSVGVAAEEESIVAAESDCVLFKSTNNEGDTVFIQTLNDSIGRIAARLCSLVVCLVSILANLVLLVRIGYLVLHYLSVAQKSVIGISAVLLLVVAAVVGLLMQDFKENYRDQICSQIEVTAYQVAGMVNAEDIQAVQSVADYEGEAYKNLSAAMQEIFVREPNYYKRIYCNLLRMEEDGSACAVAYFDQSIGTYFPLGEEETEEVVQVYESKDEVWNADSEVLSGSYLYVKVPVYDQRGNVAGVVEVGTETTVIEGILDSMQRKLLSAMLVLLLLFWILVGEITAFMENRRKSKEELAQLSEKELGQKSRQMPWHLTGQWIRILVFGVYTAYNMSSSFLPVYLMRRAESFGYLDREIAGSLPITLNIFVIGVMALLCSGFVRKWGIRKLAVLSGTFAFLGNLLIFMFPSYLACLCGLILDGLGMGLMSNAVYILITYIKSNKDRGEGLTIYNAACLSGINFGMMLGSFLAARFGQSIVFLVVSVCWFLMIGISLFVGKQLEGLREQKSQEEEKSEENRTSVWKFLCNRVVGGFFVLIQNPYIIFGSFVFYFVPIFCDGKGYSEITVSLLLLLYSEIAVLFGDTILKKMIEGLGYAAIYVAYGMNIVAVLVYAVFENMPGLLVALLLLGIAGAFGKPLQQSYFLELNQVKAYGEDKAMGVYNFTENIGESLGPMVFGKLMVQNPLLLSVAPFCGAVLLLGGIHFVGNGKNLRKMKL